MNRSLRVFARLLFHRPLVALLLSLVYGVGALLAILLESQQVGMAAALFAGFGTAGLAAVLSERIARHSQQAGCLGLPNHAAVMRRVQGWFLALFVLVPLALAIALGAPPLAATAVLAAAAAIGTSVFVYGPFWFFGLILAVQFSRFESWIVLAPVQAAIVALSGVLIWRWFALPLAHERIGALPVVLPEDFAPADSTRHDGQAARDGQDTPRAVADPIDAFVSAETQRPGFLQRIPAALALGLGYSEKPVWRSVVRGSAIALAALFVWRFVHGAKPLALAYWWTTGGCCYALVVREQALLTAWMRSSPEQGLLRLAPQWPTDRAIKSGLVLTICRVQIGSVASWAATTTIALLLGWITVPEAVTGATVLCATSLAFAGSAWALLAHRRIREVRFSTVALVVLVAAGAATLLWPDPTPARWVAGSGLMLAPPLVALAWFCTVPLRFPLDVDARALKAL